MELCILSILCNFDWNLNIWYFFFPNILFLLYKHVLKSSSFFHTIYKFIVYLFLLTGINRRFFLKNKTETNKKTQTPKPFIILKLLIPTASWELLMSAGESGWYQELNIPSSLGSLWRARKAPKTTGWKKPIFLLGELVPTTMETGKLLKSNKVGHLQKFYPELTGFTFLDFVAVK